MAGLILLMTQGAATPARAHPHVFVDGGVDLAFDGSGTLVSVEVTWIYDAFETLYMLSEAGMSLKVAGGLAEEDRVALERRLSNWPSDFDGSANVTYKGAPVALAWPEQVSVEVRDGRLHKRFVRRLEDPFRPQAEPLRIGYYESSYFFDFSVTQETKITGRKDCTSVMEPFHPSPQDKALQAALASLSREESPTMQNVGALFADWITVTCR